MIPCHPSLRELPKALSSKPEIFRREGHTNQFLDSLQKKPATWKFVSKLTLKSVVHRTGWQHYIDIRFYFN
jgi:hypothetical protein